MTCVSFKTFLTLLNMQVNLVISKIYPIKKAHVFFFIGKFNNAVGVESNAYWAFCTAKTIGNQYIYTLKSRCNMHLKFFP